MSVELPQLTSTLVPPAVLVSISTRPVPKILAEAPEPLPLALNPASEFEGGGTWFASLDDAIKISQGQIVSHASALLHGGHGITSGKRYILVGFVILEGYDSWSMRFYNQVRNL